MLTASSFDDALSIAAQNGQSGGHNYQIVSWNNVNVDNGAMNVSNVETAYDGLHKFTIIEPSSSRNTETNGNWTFHANRYIHLNISQPHNHAYVSSSHREERAQELGAPRSVDDMLNNLGDTQDSDYPIYGNGPSGFTLHTVVFDANNCKVTIYADNPKMKNQIMQFNRSQICN